MNPRFAKLSPDEMSPAQREVAAQIAAGPRGEVRGPFVALIHNAGLAGAVQQLGEHLRYKSKLPPRTLEMAVLITARRWTCQHEWYMHEPLARKAGLEPAIIDALAAGREPQNLAPDAAAVYAFCREAHATGRVSDEPFDAVVARHRRDGALELLALCGYYSMMAMVLNTAGLPLPNNAPPPLKSGSG
jgi:4-carboxymuconolactone decarboxylase